MGGPITEIPLFRGLDGTWAPLSSVEAGWDRLDTDHQDRVIRRTRIALDRFDPPNDVDTEAMRRFFSFLAHMESIGIDIPLSSLSQADPDTVPMLELQLSDEVFHAALFARIATRHGGLEPPLPEAERLLEQMRAPEDPRVTHVLLNLIAEDWFETLFEHASTWGIADEIFRMALADEERHVEEGHVHAKDITPEEVEPDVRGFEAELYRLVQHPRIILPTLALAGEANMQALSEAYLATHEHALNQIGLAPDEALEETQRTLDELRIHEERLDEIPEPTRIEPETQWRETALHLWDTPRHPVMHGWFDVPMDHIPSDRLTPIFVAAIGRVWNEYPRMNRFTIGGELYEPARVNVGVRVAIGTSQEALSTIVIPDAHERSVSDIQRILATGVREMNELGNQLDGMEPDDDTEPLRDVLLDEDLMRMVPPETVAAPVTVSNVGPAGLVAGVGAMPGALGQSVEFIIGRVQDRPVWNGERYVPGDVATVGASADHRVFDGQHSAHAMSRIQKALNQEGVEAILTREDTFPPDADLADIALAEVGLSQQRAQVLMSCKAPFWLGWLCWLFKK